MRLPGVALSVPVAEGGGCPGGAAVAGACFAGDGAAGAGAAEAVGLVIAEVPGGGGDPGDQPAGVPAGLPRRSVGLGRRPGGIKIRMKIRVESGRKGRVTDARQAETSSR